eukprot:gene13538-13664_t
MDDHRGHLRGYLAMLVVDNAYRGKGLGRALAKMAIEEMVRGEAEEVVLEAEVTNTGALALYRSLGFIRDKHLHSTGGSLIKPTDAALDKPVVT